MPWVCLFNAIVLVSVTRLLENASRSLLSSTLLYYISQVIWVSKYSTGWWPHIRWGRLEMKLPRPNYTKLDPFFCKKGGFYIFQSKAFFLGSCRSLFWALGGSFCDPWTRFQFWGGISKNEGGFKERISCRAPVKIKDNLYMHALSMWFIEGGRRTIFIG